MLKNIGETISELYNYFVDKYFTPSRLVYDNFDLTNTLMPLSLVIFSIFIGVILASIFAIYNKCVLGDFIRKLISEDCLSSDRARSLSALGFEKNYFIRVSLKEGGSLRKFVMISKNNVPPQNSSDSIVKSDSNKKESNFNFSDLLFYINESDKIKAELRFDKKGTNFLSLIFVIIFSIIAIIFLIFIIPELLTMLDNFLSSVKPNDSLPRF